MATQKQVLDALRVWNEATSMKEAVEAARQTAEFFDGLYEESATNLLARTPELLKLLAAYLAGKKEPETTGGLFDV